MMSQRFQHAKPKSASLVARPVAKPVRAGVNQPWQALFDRALSGNPVALAQNTLESTAKPLQRKGEGLRLPGGLRNEVEADFGHDFSTVRVHREAAIGQMGAAAAARGEDLYFAPGRYDPDGQSGRHLIRHELAHVVQAREGRVPEPDSPTGDWIHHGGLEAEAERLAAHGGKRDDHGEKAVKPAPSGPSGSRAVQAYFIISRDQVLRNNLGTRVPTAAQPVAIIQGAATRLDFQQKTNAHGFLNPADHNQANVIGSQRARLRVSDNRDMAVMETDLSGQQAKNFFATTNVLQASRKRLAVVQSNIDLNQAAGSIRIYTARNRYTELHEVVPVARAGAMRTPQNCNTMAGYVTGAFGNNALSLLNTVVPRGALPKGAQANVTCEVNLSLSQYIAGKLGTLRADHLQAIENNIVGSLHNPVGYLQREDNLKDRIASDYHRAIGRPGAENLLKRLGVNRFSAPEVGDAHVIHTTPGTGVHAGEIRDYQSGRSFVPNWTYHFGGVVAKSGHDHITMENYARGNDEPMGNDPANDPRWYFQMYSGAHGGQSFHETHVAMQGYANPITMTLHRRTPRMRALRMQANPENKKEVAVLGLLALLAGYGAYHYLLG